MRKFLLIGTAATSLVFGAAGAYAIPANSPYATWEPQAVDPGVAGPMNEGRSAYVDGQDAYAPVATIPTPEDSTYYSRGK